MREAVELGMVECSRPRAQKSSVANNNRSRCRSMGGEEKTVQYKLSPSRLFTNTLYFPEGRLRTNEIISVAFYDHPSTYPLMVYLVTTRREIRD